MGHDVKTSSVDPADQGRLTHPAGTAHVPIVLFSAHHQRVNEMGNYGWDAFVGKPFDIDDIKQVVGRFVKAKDS